MRHLNPYLNEGYPDQLLKYDLTPEEFIENRKCYVHEFLSTGKFEDEVNLSAPTFPDKDDAIIIQCYFTGAVDPNIVSFALPGIVVAPLTLEHIPRPGYGTPEGWSPHRWSIILRMEDGTDCTKLAPIITLAPGATITRVEQIIDGQFISEQVDYTGIAEIGVYDFSHRVNFVLIAPDGSTVNYGFIATDSGPCVGCP